MTDNAQPISLVTIEEPQGITLGDIDQLREILDGEDVRNKPVCLVTVAGVYRSGKSFLLSLFLRFLRACMAGAFPTRNDSSWLRNFDQPLTGFNWRGGQDRETRGILIWPETFLMRAADGQEVVVLLMDTQGTFDGDTTLGENTAIFALSTMVSSVLIYNIRNDIKEYDLQYLSRFMEYAQTAMESSESCPFQKLLFLVRDYEWPYDFAYGSEGGHSLVTTKLQASERQSPELRDLRRHIQRCFSEVTGFLLPHIGLRAATNQGNQDILRDVEEAFLDHVSALTWDILAPENLIAKNINGTIITCGQLPLFLTSYINGFTSGDIPTPMFILGELAEHITEDAYLTKKEYYRSHMNGVLAAFPAESLVQKHEEYRDEALIQYDTQCICLTDALAQATREQKRALLEDYIRINTAYILVELADPKCNEVCLDQTESYNAGMSSSEVTIANVILKHEQCQGRALNGYETTLLNLRNTPAEEIMANYKQRLTESTNKLGHFTRQLIVVAYNAARNHFTNGMRGRMWGFSTDSYRGEYYALKDESRRQLESACSSLIGTQMESFMRDYINRLQAANEGDWEYYKDANQIKRGKKNPGVAVNNFFKGLF